MSTRILVDENAMRLFTDPKWAPLKDALEARGFVLVKLDRWKYGSTDQHLAEYIVHNNFDGIITEDSDFVETNRYPLFNTLMNAGKKIYLVQRVPSTSTRYEFRVYKYENRKKEFLFKIKPSGDVSTDAWY